MPTKTKVLGIIFCLGIPALITAGCSSVFSGASIDVTNISINAHEQVSADAETQFIIEYSNRSSELGEFQCSVEPMGATVTVKIPANMTQGFTELSMPGLASGQHVIRCGPLVDGERPELFVLSRDFAVSPDLAVSSVQAKLAH